MKFILGKKIGMSQIFKEGKIIPVTLIEAGPCFVTQIKEEKGIQESSNKGKGKGNDGYNAVQVGFERLEGKKVKRTQKGKPFKHLREFRTKEIENYKVGQKIDLSVFKEGEKVKVSGISKGKGFQGAVKRWGFSGRNATHGVKHEHRTLGSVGSSFPERVLKGKKMPGRMGYRRVTVKNLEIVKIDQESNIIALKGAVPGRRGMLLEISNF
ncbi:50S ribosomal protein L3 [bacterium]|nr:50S ribosomal protein L3 [bacterium]